MAGTSIKNSDLIPKLMIAAGIAGLFAPMLWSFRADMLQRALQKEAEAQSRAQGTAGIASKPQIIIPKIGLDATIVEETRESDLDRGPMHLANTGEPGEIGNCCIAAHKEKWFRNLKQLKVGDEVTIRASEMNYVYIVIGRQIVRADEVSVLDPTPIAQLTLITCTGPAYFGHGNGRLVVNAIMRPETGTKR